MDKNALKELEETIIRDYGNTAGIVVCKNGETVYEHYFGGYAPNNALHVFSVTKSVFSLLLGIALDQGRIESADQKVLDFFPDYTPPQGEKTIQKITTENLLTMTAPYKYDNEPYEQFFISPDPVRDALNYLGGDKPIGRFNYAAIGGAHILSGILSKAIGRPILDFANEYLFGPMDIDVPRNIVLNSAAEHMAVMNSKAAKGWAVDAQGLNTAGWGLFLTPADMAKIGQLCLNRGAWQGRQLVSARWLDTCTAPHSRWDEMGLDYGYLWWIIDKDSFAAMGDGGNVIYVNKKKRLAVSVAAAFAAEPKDRIELIKTRIEPLFAD